MTHLQSLQPEKLSLYQGGLHTVRGLPPKCLCIFHQPVCFLSGCSVVWNGLLGMEEKQKGGAIILILHSRAHQTHTLGMQPWEGGEIAFGCDRIPLQVLGVKLPLSHPCPPICKNSLFCIWDGNSVLAKCKK